MYFAMARDRVFFRSLADVHPRFGTPALAGRLQRLVVDGARVSGTFEQLFTYVVFASWIFAALAAASVFRATPAPPGRPPAVPRPGLSRYAGAVSSPPAAAIVGNTIVARPVQALIGLGDRGDGGARVLRVETQAEALEHVRSPRLRPPLSRRYSLVSRGASPQ